MISDHRDVISNHTCGTRAIRANKGLRKAFTLNCNITEQCHDRFKDDERHVAKS